MDGLLPLALSGIRHYFNRWRLALVFLLVVYAAVLLINLDYSAIQWDETPHLVGGLLLSRGQIQDYTQYYTYYPPLFDSTAAIYYIVLGSSLFSVRLVSVTFTILSVFITFDYAYKIYGPKVALLSSLLLASMPGLIILSRLALIETMLMFFFSASMFLFFLWMRTKSNKLLFLTIITFGLGIIAKYQIIIGGLVMLVSLLLLQRDFVVAFVKKYSKLLIVAVIALAVLVSLFFVLYPDFASGTLGDWLYAMQIGSTERSAYSERFPLPIFYLIEMTYPYSHINPISPPLYILGLLGLAFWMWRRKPEDKFSLIWFVVVYIAFTFINNKNWRYVMPLFPVLAVSASDFILSLWDKLNDKIHAIKPNVNRSVGLKIAAVGLVILLGASFFFSWRNAYTWVAQDNVHIPIDEAAQYVIANSASDEAVCVLFIGNFFNTEMVKYYLLLHNSADREIWRYPLGAIDSFRPVLNQTFLIERCEASNVKYLLLYEYGNITYFDSDWKSYDVFDMLTSSDRFTFETQFGTYPRRVTIIRFVSDS